MAEIIREGAPRSFVKGATVRWYERDAQYPASVFATGAALSLTQANDKRVATTVADNGDDRYLVTISATDSAAFSAGSYYYQMRVGDGSTVHNIRSGVILVLEDLALITGGHDGRTSAARIYDTVSAVMEEKASHDQSSMAIGGRQLSRYTWGELVEMRGHFAFQMSDEERIARGYMPNRPMTVRFTR